MREKIKWIIARVGPGKYAGVILAHLAAFLAKRAKWAAGEQQPSERDYDPAWPGGKVIHTDLAIEDDGRFTIYSILLAGDLCETCGGLPEAIAQHVVAPACRCEEGRATVTRTLTEMED